MSLASGTDLVSSLLAGNNCTAFLPPREPAQINKNQYTPVKQAGMGSSPRLLGNEVLLVLWLS